MNISMEKREGCTILTLKGRLDTEGAVQLNPFIERINQDDEKTLVIDMNLVPYISSGGIRALHGFYKARKNKSGLILLAGTGEFTRKVLELSGFSRIFPQFATVEQALHSLRGGTSSIPAEWNIAPSGKGSTMVIRYRRVSAQKAGLVSSGPWKQAYLSGLKTEDLQPPVFGQNDYAIGIGGFGPTPAECTGVLGNLVSAGPINVWAPPGNGKADYILKGPDIRQGQAGAGLTSETPGIFSACSLVLDGDIHEVFLFEPVNSPGNEFTLGELVTSIFRHAGKDAGRSNSVIAVKILAQVTSYETINLQKSLFEGNRPANRDPVWSEKNQPEWFALSRTDLKEEETLVGFGIIHNSSVKNGLDKEIISSLFPEGFPTDMQGCASHILGISFKRENWNPGTSIDMAIRTIVTGGEFAGMHQLAAGTCIRTALVGVSYIDTLRREDGPVIEIDAPCPEWTGYYEAITLQLHRGSKKVLLSPISGGFSGSLVFRASVTDRSDRRQMPFVMKLGPWSMISDEIRGYSDHVERYIQNSSTRLIQHCRIGEYGGILYNFVGIDSPASTLTSLEDYYLQSSPEKAEAAFDHLFRVVLKTWYGQPVRQEIPLYRQYQDPPGYEFSREYAISQFGVNASDPDIDLPFNLGKSANPLHFIESVVPTRISRLIPAYTAPQHGDLNLKNVLLDQDGNMWLIDFSDTRVSHNLRDIAKMETVIRTEMISYTSDDEVKQMAGWDLCFLDIKGLSDIPPLPGSDLPEDREKAFRVIRKLRYYADHVTVLDDNGDQYLLALLWYTLPALWYRSVGEYGKKFAWITASRICERLRKHQHGQ